jgi:phosphodiesterase/alkaline phosphatase D-like protein
LISKTISIYIRSLSSSRFDDAPKARGRQSRGGGGGGGGNGRGSTRAASPPSYTDSYYADDGGGGGIAVRLGALVAQARRADVRANIPAIFCVSGLSPVTRYVLRVEASNGDAVLPGHFRTLSPDPTALRIACFSCDKITVADHDRLWENLAARAERDEVDLFLHLGDQVYADSAYKVCAKVVKERGLDAARADREALVEHYRAIYRKTFTSPATARVYAAASHLMIWDDHELVNDWGTPDAHRDKSAGNVRYFLGGIARQAYCEYQKQLWDNVDTDELVRSGWDGTGTGAAAANGTGLDAHTHVYGTIGVLFLDLRGGRSFHHEPGFDMDFLGRAQWELIANALSNGGEFSACRAIIVASSIPLAYSSAIMSSAIGSTMPWVRDKMGFGLNRPEQSRLFAELQAWKDNMPGREIVAVAGDMHATCEGHVLRGGERLLTQVVCSPIANNPPQGFKFWWMRFMSARRLAFWGGQFTYRRTKEWDNARNYSILNVDTERRGGDLITWETIKG